MQHATDLRDLLEHATWVRGLARRLTHDDASADDLAQDAWIAAVRNPPKAPAAPKAWLAQVLRNASHMTHRSAGRRLAREEAAHEVPSPIPGADQLAEEVELGRLLAEEVLALAEARKETLLLHFYRGLTSAEIGASMNVPAATVRSRLKAGLEEVRAALDRRYGARDTWLRALAPLASLPLSTPALPVAKGTSMLKIALATTLLAGTGAGAVYVTHLAPPMRAPTVSTAIAQTNVPAPHDRAAQRRAHDDLLGRIQTKRASLPAGAAVGTLDKNYIQSQIVELLPLVKECFEETLTRKPSASGTVFVRFTITADETLGGLIADSEIVDEKSTFADDETRRCIQESVYAARFPSPEGGGDVVFEYPFTLMAPDAPEPQ